MGNDCIYCYGFLRYRIYLTILYYIQSLVASLLAYTNCTDDLMIPGLIGHIILSRLLGLIHALVGLVLGVLGVLGGIGVYTSRVSPLALLRFPLVNNKGKKSTYSAAVPSSGYSNPGPCSWRFQGSS